MKLKASVDYGVRAIMYLALKGGTCSSREISDEMSIPRDYLIQLALKRYRQGEKISYTFDTNILSMGGSFGSKGSKR